MTQEEIFQRGVFGQEVLADSCVYASGSQPTWGRGLIVFDRCETCDCMTGIPLSAADDRVSVLQRSSGCGWWVSDLTCDCGPNAALSAQHENQICVPVLDKHHCTTTTTTTTTTTAATVTPLL